MATVGQTIENPASGERFTFLRTARDTGGQFVQMEMTVKPGGAVPAAHIHARQEEEFEVLAGTLRLRAGNEPARLLGAGDAHVVAAGVAHEWSNAGEGAVRVRITIRPALDIETMFETICGLANDGKVDARGAVPFLQGVLLADAYAIYRPDLPVPVQQALVALLRPLARLRGYRARYPQYSALPAAPGLERAATT